MLWKLVQRAEPVFECMNNQLGLEPGKIIPVVGTRKS